MTSIDGIVPTPKQLRSAPESTGLAGTNRLVSPFGKHRQTEFTELFFR